MALSVTEVNIKLAQALGLSTANLLKVRIDLQPGEMPAVVAEYMLTSPDGLVAAMDHLQLVPKGAQRAA